MTSRRSGCHLHGNGALSAWDRRNSASSAARVSMISPISRTCGSSASSCLGRAVGRDPLRHVNDREIAFLRATVVATALALRHQLPRQHRRDEARRSHGSRLLLRGRLLQGGTAARPAPSWWSISSSTATFRRGELLLRRGLRRPCALLASGRARLAARVAPDCALGRGRGSCRGRHGRLHGGPQFSTLAESLTYKSQGFDVIGMTSMPEAKLAREAELTIAWSPW